MQKLSIKFSDKAVGIVIGAMLSVLLVVVEAAIVGYLVVSGRVGEQASEVIVVIISAAAIFVGCEASLKMNGSRQIGVAAITAIIYLLLMIMIGLLVVEGKLDFSGGYMGAIGAGCVVSCIKCLKKPSRKVSRKRYSR